MRRIQSTAAETLNQRVGTQRTSRSVPSLIVLMYSSVVALQDERYCSKVETPTKSLPPKSSAFTPASFSCDGWRTSFDVSVAELRPPELPGISVRGFA